MSAVSCSKSFHACACSQKVSSIQQPPCEASACRTNGFLSPITLGFSRSHCSRCVRNLVILATPSSSRWIERKSKKIRRDCLRPSFCSMPIQFWNEPSTKVWGDTVTMVLSKLRTLTVVSVISSTRPLAPAEATVIQSPTCSMSLDVRRMPATSPLMVS